MAQEMFDRILTLNLIGTTAVFFAAAGRPPGGFRGPGRRPSRMRVHPRGAARRLGTAGGGLMTGRVQTPGGRPPSGSCLVTGRGAGRDGPRIRMLDFAFP
jgi:hypothetical protein